MTRETAFERVRSVLVELTSSMGFDQDDVTDDTSLVTDLGLESMHFVELTVALEQAFGLDEFPMQDWVAEQNEAGADGFRVRALVDRCLQQARG